MSDTENPDPNEALADIAAALGVEHTEPFQAVVRTTKSTQKVLGASIFMLDPESEEQAPKFGQLPLSMDHYVEVLQAAVDGPFAKSITTGLAAMLNAYPTQASVIDRLADENSIFRRSERILLELHSAVVDVLPTSTVQQAFNITCEHDQRWWPCPTVIAWQGRSRMDKDFESWASDLREQAIDHISKKSS